MRPDSMIGRAGDVERIAVSLLGGGNVVLAGPRRIGKTTVADAALEFGHAKTMTVC